MGSNTTTNYTVSVPPSLNPVLMQNTARMVGIANQPYVPYQGQRVADWDPMSQYAYQNAWSAGQNTAPAYQNAMNSTGYGINAAFNTGSWDAGTASRYMSPYQQGVTDIAKSAAIDDKQRNDMAMNANLIGRGAFGSTRHGVIAADANRNLMSTLNNIQTNGLNAAWTQGQNQFNADRSANLAGINTGLQGANQYGNLASNLQGANLGLLDFQNNFGRQGQAYNQTMMDIGYEDWLNNRDYDRNNTTWLNEQLRSTGNTTVTQQPRVNPYSQLLGAGLAAYGAYANSKT